MNFLKNLLFNLCDITPPVHTTSDSSNNDGLIIFLFVALGIAALIIVILLAKYVQSKKRNTNNQNYNADFSKNSKPEDEIGQIHLDRETARSNNQEESFQQQPPAHQQVPEAQVAPQKNNGILKFVFAIILVVIIILSSIMIVNCVNDTNRNSQVNNSSNSGNSGNSGSSNNSTPQLFSRNANNNDIFVEFLDDISLSMKYRIKPNVDIKNLQLTFSYSNKSHIVIATKVKNVGNVTEGVQFEISISLSEFSLSDIWNITLQSVAVTGGTVSYLR